MTAPSPRKLTAQDRDAARNYASRNISDPFAYARALSRLANQLCTAEDLAGNSSL